jgi:hypothetical protein
MNKTLELLYCCLPNFPHIPKIKIDVMYCSIKNEFLSLDINFKSYE